MHYTNQSPNLQIGVRILVSDKIGVKIYYLRQIIRILLNGTLIALGRLFCYFLSMSIYNFYTYIYKVIKYKYERKKYQIKIRKKELWVKSSCYTKAIEAPTRSDVFSHILIAIKD